MIKLNSKLLYAGIFCIISGKLLAQSTNGAGANAFVGGRYIGWNNTNGTNPLLIKTNNITRMQINGLAGGYGVNTSGYIGIGTNNPASPIHIVGNQQQAAVGWRRGITLANSASLVWDGAGGDGFLMAHPSSTPTGNFYAGVLKNLNVGSGVNYAYQVYVNQTMGLNNPQASTQFFKNVLVYQGNYGRYFGVNTLNPQKAAEVYSNNTQMRLSYGFASFVSPGNIPTIYTDFKTNPQGNLQIMPTGNRVGINLNANPTANLDVNGNARIRNVQASTPNSILVGVNASGSNDVFVRRLDFNGNSNTFLSGNGTFQTINTTPPQANNGVSRHSFMNPNAPYQLGDKYLNNFSVPFFNTSTPLTTNRQVRLNGQSLIFSGNGKIGIGLSYPVLPTESLDVNGNGRFRTLPDATNQANNSVNKYVMVDNNGVLRWSSSSPSGLACWDINGDGVQDPAEDINNDGIWDALDCQGVQGNVGPAGPQGPIGLTGPQGPAGGIILAQNGLNLFDPTTVELGGLLLHNTEVTLNNHDMVFNNSYGNFIVGNTNILNPGISAHQNIILGLGNIINFNPIAYPSGWLHHVFGNDNVLNNSSITVVGSGNEIGNSSYASSGVNDFVIGLYNKSHSTSFASESFTIGKLNENEGYYNYTFGKSNKINGEEAYSYGNNNISKGFRTHAFGNKVYSPEYIVSIGNSYSQSAINVESYVTSGGDLSLAHLNMPTAVQDIPAINISNTNNVAIKKYYATAALDVEGTILQNGNIVSSDASLKHNIQDLEMNADSLIKLLKPRMFEWNTVSDTFMLGTQYGFIAQEFEQVIPEFVRQGRDSIRHINTTALFPLLVMGYQKQSASIDSLNNQVSALQNSNDSLSSQVQDLNNRLSQLENCLSGILPLLCQLSHNAIQANTPEAQEELRKQLQVTLTNREAIILDQNVPNPFAEQTVINFAIPASVQKAQILFYDGNGKLLNSVDIVERGLGSITVYGSDLSMGVYTYTLVADGQIVATKKMMKQ